MTTGENIFSAEVDSDHVSVAQEEAGRLAMLANSGVAVSAEAVDDAQMLASQMASDSNSRLVSQSVSVEPTARQASLDRVRKELSDRARSRAFGSGAGAYPAIQKAKSGLRSTRKQL